jgi:hypothetical protein
MWRLTPATAVVRSISNGIAKTGSGRSPVAGRSTTDGESQ